MFLTTGMTDFFQHMKEVLRKEGLDENSLRQLFKGLRGIVLLDTLGDPENLRREVEKLESDLQILKIMEIGTDNLNNVIQEAIEKNNKRRNAKS
jgi:hypothetical protein